MNVVFPIKDEKKIKLMKLILRDQNDRGQGVRNLLLFVMGINTALRVSDLLALTIDDVRDDKGRMPGPAEIRGKIVVISVPALR